MPALKCWTTRPPRRRQITDDLTRTIRRAVPGVLLVLLTVALISCAHKDDGSDQSAAISPSPASEPTVLATTAIEPVQGATPKRTFRTGEAVPAGYFGYRISSSWFSEQIPGAASSKRSPGNYLNLDLTIVNTDAKERAPGALKLIDENGQQYRVIEMASKAEQSFGENEKLGSGVSKRAIAIFEAPKGHQYKLKIPGFSAAEEVEIELSPKSHVP